MDIQIVSCSTNLLNNSLCLVMTSLCRKWTNATVWLREVTSYCPAAEEHHAGEETSNVAKQNTIKDYVSGRVNGFKLVNTLYISLRGGGTVWWRRWYPPQQNSPSRLVCTTWDKRWKQRLVCLLNCYGFLYDGKFSRRLALMKSSGTTSRVSHLKTIDFSGTI